MCRGLVRRDGAVIGRWECAVPCAPLTPPPPSSRSEARPSVLVVDVRDSDFEGGHIRGCLNRPALNFDQDADVDEFIDRELKPGIKTVVMHCALSQVRGPHCAQR